MFTRLERGLVSGALAAVLSVYVATTAYGQTAPAAPSAAQRQLMGERHKKMAEIHAKMAACLVSDRPLSQCRRDMADGLATHFKGNGPMMGRGMMGGRGMGPANAGSCAEMMMSPDADISPPAAKPNQ